LKQVFAAIQLVSINEESRMSTGEPPFALKRARVPLCVLLIKNQEGALESLLLCLKMAMVLMFVLLMKNKEGALGSPLFVLKRALVLRSHGEPTFVKGSGAYVCPINEESRRSPGEPSLVFEKTMVLTAPPITIIIYVQ